MNMNVADIIEEAEKEIRRKIEDAQNSLADQGMERAMRYYLQAAQRVIYGLRRAGELLRLEAEYLPAGDERADELGLQINIYLKGTRLFPILTEIVNSLEICLEAWKTKAEEMKKLGEPPTLAQPLVDQIQPLLHKLALWQSSLVSGAGSGEGLQGKAESQAKAQYRPPGMTGVGYDTLLEVRRALESGEARQELRKIVRQFEPTDAEQLAQIDLLIEDLSAMATELASATRANR